MNLIDFKLYICTGFYTIVFILNFFKIPKFIGHKNRYKNTCVKR